MGQTLKIKAGYDRTWKSTLLAQDTGLPTPYPPDATFAVAVARGVGEPTLFAPTGVWDDDRGGSAAAAFNLIISRTQTAGLDPGIYIIQGGVWSGGILSEAFDGQLEITGVPGAMSLRSPYVTARDLAIFHPLLKTIQSYQEDDADFLMRRSLASDEFDNRFLEYYKHMDKVGFVKRRRPEMEKVAGLGFDVADPTADPPTPSEMAGYLADDGLKLGTGPNREVPRQVKEAVCKIAIADLLEGQETASARNSYRDEAADMRLEVDKLWRGYDIQVDTDGDGEPDILVGSDIVLLTEAP
jgi:hypothetical protein